jgi:hypothetical protein
MGKAKMDEAKIARQGLGLNSRGGDGALINAVALP